MCGSRSAVTNNAGHVIYAIDIKGGLRTFAALRPNGRNSDQKLRDHAVARVGVRFHSFAKMWVLNYLFSGLAIHYEK